MYQNDKGNRLPLAAQSYRPKPMITPPASQNTTVVFLPSDTNPVPDTFGSKQEQTTKN